MIFAGMVVLAAAVVGGEWAQGTVRFETGNEAVNRIVAERPSGEYSSKVIETYELLRHTGKSADAKRDWQSLYDQVEKAASNRCDKAVSKDEFIGACYWLLETRMMLEIGPAVEGRWAYHKKYVPMNLGAVAYIRERFIGADGMLKPPYRGQVLPSAFTLYLGLVDGTAQSAITPYHLGESPAVGATARELKDVLSKRSLPPLGAFEWRVVLDALAQNGMADVAYGLVIDGGKVDRGAALSWLWRTAAGIASDPTCDGFRNIIMAPVPDRRLGFVRAEYKSPVGIVKSAWRYEGGKWIWDFTVPAKSTASVTLPGQRLTRHYDGGDHQIVMEGTK